MKALKSFLFLLVFSTVGLKADAHNAVTYISEEAIVLIGIGLSTLLLGLIFGITGLFKVHRFLRVFTIVSACIGSIIALFLISQSFNSFGNAFIPPLLYSIILWVLIAFRKANSRALIKAKPLFLGLIEGIAIIVGGWFITIISQGFFMDHRTLFYIVLYLFMFLIILTGHRLFYQKRFEANLSLEPKLGKLATMYSALSSIGIFFLFEILRYMGSGYSMISIENSLLIFAMAVLPQILFGFSLSSFYSKTYSVFRKNQA
jgi:hypothetical protein